MSTDALDQLSDAELSERVAVECASHNPNHVKRNPTGGLYLQYSPGGFCSAIPPFATSADAVLPLLELAGREVEFRWNPKGRLVLFRHNGPGIVADAPTFARAACIALLRAKRAEKGAEA